MAGACRVMSASPAMVAPPMPSLVTLSGQVETGVRTGSRTGGAASPMLLSNPPCTLAFVYGTLKQGFSNHWLIEDVVAQGHAHFIGVARTKRRYPLVCGPFQVPFLLNMPSCGCHVKGELYAVDQSALELLDELEGVTKGHYMRHALVLTGLQSLEVDCPPTSELLAEAYFAAAPLTRGLSIAPHIEAYTKKETVTYIRRKDRPQNRTFLEHVHHWIESQELVSQSRV